MRQQAREVLTAKAEKLNNEAVDNGLIRENGQFQFIEGSSGVEVNVEKSLMTIEDYLKTTGMARMPRLTLWQKLWSRKERRKNWQR